MEDISDVVSIPKAHLKNRLKYKQTSIKISKQREEWLLREVIGSNKK
jgi:hypothetical protein